MQLYYYKTPHKNIGDDLNSLLWGKLYSAKFEVKSDHLFIGIGTILNNRLPPKQYYTVAGSGIGYGELPRLADSSWEFLAVRGPITKNALALNDGILCLDPAYLTPLWYRPKIKLFSSKRVGVIPHLNSITRMPWHIACRRTGLTLIDVRSDPKKFIQQLINCNKVLVEAMHGAILADAYSIPWSPIKAYPGLNIMKWEDWGKSVNLEISHTLIPEAWRIQPHYRGKIRLKATAKKALELLGFNASLWWAENHLPHTTAKMQNQFIEGLDAAINSTYILSDRSIVTEKTNALNEIFLSYFSK